MRDGPAGEEVVTSSAPNTLEHLSNQDAKTNTTSGDSSEVTPDTQDWTPPNPTSHLSSPTSSTLVRSTSLQNFFTSHCTQLISCPNPSCDFFFESSGIGECKRLDRPDGQEPSAEALTHFQQFRHRCRKCSEDFCSQCKKMPYHEGYTCAEYEHDSLHAHCRFCDKLLPEREITVVKEQLQQLCTNINTVVQNVCDECAPKEAATHDGVLPCKHQKHCTSNHLGSCPPCIHPDCTDGVSLEDDCLLCGTNRLKNAPIIKLKCTHYFHYDCVIDRLTQKWRTPEINLQFTRCSICSQNISAFFKTWEDNELMKEVTSFRQHLSLQVISTVQREGVQIDHPEGSNLYLDEALHRFNFYECFTCKSIYYGGTRACGESVEVNREELRCGGCRSHCVVHGDAHMVYKCRFCCTPASYFCFGHTHFCQDCHSNAWALLQGSHQGYLKKEVPPCAGKDQCPLRIDHPPNGEEFALGCALCDESIGLSQEPEQKPVTLPTESPKQMVKSASQPFTFHASIETSRRQKNTRKRKKRG